jgi:hypothetical protein
MLSSIPVVIVPDSTMTFVHLPVHVMLMGGYMHSKHTNLLTETTISELRERYCCNQLFGPLFMDSTKYHMCALHCKLPIHSVLA